MDQAAYQYWIEEYRKHRRAGAWDAAQAALLEAHDLGWGDAQRHIAAHLRFLRILLQRRTLRGWKVGLIQLLQAAPHTWGLWGDGPPRRGR